VSEPDVVVELPTALRPELKEPLGPVFTDTGELLAAVSDPLVTVGDVVTYHLLETGRTPAIALVDERTERSAVDEKIAATIAEHGFDSEVTVANPAATLTAGLLSALRSAIDRTGDGTTLIAVDGEEDLATLPAILALSQGSVIYGQPGEGMVHVAVDGSVREHVRDLFSRMDGDTGRLWRLLGV